MAQADKDDGGRGTMAPYVPFQTLKTLLDSLKPHRLPGRIDRSLLRNFSGATQGQLITAIRFLGLVDAKGIPTERLEKIHTSYGTERWPEALAELLRKNYEPIFAVGLDTASPGQFYERYRNTFPGAEDVVRKSATFFLNAAREAKIEISEHIMRNKKPRSAGAARRRSRVVPARSAAEATPPANPGAGTQASSGASDSAPPRPPTSFELLAAFDPSDMTNDERNAVWTLIQYLRRKEVGGAATKHRRDASPKTRPAAAAVSNEGGIDRAALAEPPSATASG